MFSKEKNKIKQKLLFFLLQSVALKHLKHTDIANDRFWLYNFKGAIQKLSLCVQCGGEKRQNETNVSRHVLGWLLLGAQTAEQPLSKQRTSNV